MKTSVILYYFVDLNVSCTHYIYIITSSRIRILWENIEHYPQLILIINKSFYIKIQLTICLLKWECIDSNKTENLNNFLAKLK